MATPYGRIPTRNTNAQAQPVTISGNITLVANSTINLNQVGGIGITLGQKVMASSIPVVIASDQGTLTVSQTPMATGGNTLSTNFVDAVTAKTQVKGSAGRLYGWHLYNPNTSTVYVQMFDNISTGVTLGTTTPTWVIIIPAGGVIDDPTLSIPYPFGTGFTYAVTTTSKGSIAPSSGITGNWNFM